MKIKVLFLLNSLAFGGAEKQTVALLNQLDRTRFIADLCYLENKTDLLPFLDTTKMDWCACLHKRRKFDPSVIAKLHACVDRGQYDIVACVNAYPLIYAHLVKITTRRPLQVIEICHTTLPLPGLWTRIKNYLYVRLFNKSNGIIYVSGSQKAFWEANYHVDAALATYIHNGIDTVYFQDRYTREEKNALRADLGFHKDDCIAGICAVLRPEKNHNAFVDAVGDAISRGHRIKGLIIGDGPLMPSVSSYLREKGLADQIAVTGFQSDVRSFIGICDMIILTSVLETFSMAVLEAMAMGKPVIMTDVGGAREQIRHGIDGYLYPCGHMDQLVTYMIRLTDREIHGRLSKAAEDAATTKFSIETMVSAYENYLRALVAHPMNRCGDR